MHSTRFRPAQPSDAAALGELHVATWRESYVDLIPQKMLSGLSIDERIAMWSRVLADDPAVDGTAVFVAEQDDTMVGFATCCAQRDEALKRCGFDGEIGAIYVRRSQQRTGVGRSLVAMAAARLLKANRRSATLWVLTANAGARAFYQRLGGAVVAARDMSYDDAILAETAYGWRDLTRLTAHEAFDDN